LQRGSNIFNRLWLEAMLQFYHFFSTGTLQNIHGPRAAHINYIKLILPNLVASDEYYILFEMIVEEMIILTIVFLWYYNEKIYYPNSALPHP
jgi:hypothetical protein